MATAPIGERLADEREWLGLSVTRVSEHTGLTKDTITAVEAGTHIDTETLVVLCRYFRLDQESDACRVPPELSAMMLETPLTAHDAEQVARFADWLRRMGKTATMTEHQSPGNRPGG